jgi:myo-inositol-1(or 4)-monophosphatase
MGTDLAARHAEARAAIEAAGEMALGFFSRGRELAQSSKGLHDVVTEADTAVENLLRGCILAAFPGDGVLGEEGGGPTDSESGFLWILDPIDGTQEFARGTRNWCVVIAVLEHGVPVLGLVLDPSAGELFEAVRGEGATLNGASIRVSDAQSLSDGVVTLEYSPRLHKDQFLRSMGALIDGGGTFVRGGSGALGITYVACGRSIGFIEAHMQPWDCVAAMLLVEEAGGRCNDFLAEGSLRGGGPVAAAAVNVFDAVAALLDPK